MPRKTRRPPPISPVSRRPAWPGYALTAVISALLGVGGTLLAVRRPPTPIPPVVTSPETPPADLTLGLPPASASRKLGDWFFDHRQWEKAAAAYEEAVRGGSDDANIRTDLGTAYRALGQPQKALAEYAAAQQRDAHHENSLFNQGIVYATDLGDKQRAVRIWRAYLKRFPQGTHVAEAQAFIKQASGGT